MQNFIQTYIDKGISYKEYRNLIDRLLNEGKTTGANQTEKNLAYTRLNVQRMNRLDKTVSVIPELTSLIESFDRKCIWLMIAEAWCGDCAQIIPVLNKIAETTDHIELKIILRDENPKLIDRYLTNGGRAIPKLICIDSDTVQEICTWGPRPKPAQKMILMHKTNPVKEYSEVQREIQLWYANDKGLTLQKEIMELINTMEHVPEIS
jgi:thiol-disulfide isomerase/thioredoxin